MLAARSTMAHLAPGQRKVADLFGQKSQTERQKMHMRASSHFFDFEVDVYIACVCASV